MNEVIEFNKKMIGHEVYVLTDGGWRGKVVGTPNEKTFLVTKRRKVVSVNIFDIRSLEEQNG